MPVIDFPFVGARTDYILSSLVAGLPVVGDLYRTWDSIDYMDDYLRNRGLGYESILYPTRTAGFGSLGSSVHGTVSFVSRNLEDLYEDDH